MNSDDDITSHYASPPCFLHEIDPVYAGLVGTPDRRPEDVMRWRKAERERLIAESLTIPVDVRRGDSEQISKILKDTIGDVAGLTVSAYWPFRGEPDLRGLLEEIALGGGRTALPVVIGKAQPLALSDMETGRPTGARPFGTFRCPLRRPKLPSPTS